MTNLKFFATVLGFMGLMATAKPADPLTLWYSKPATKWLEALPIGNGSLGA